MENLGLLPLLIFLLVIGAAGIVAGIIVYGDKAKKEI